MPIFGDNAGIDLPSWVGGRFVDDAVASAPTPRSLWDGRHAETEGRDRSMFISLLSGTSEAAKC
ncbi:MAG: hypothetical protein WA728_06600, partial [Xanthobacteraceae bacterium]